MKLRTIFSAAALSFLTIAVDAITNKALCMTTIDGTIDGCIDGCIEVFADLGLAIKAEIPPFDYCGFFPFEEPLTNRNHWETRGEATPAMLIMHYTVVDFRGTFNIFTRGAKIGRTSAHYVISEEDKKANILGGKIFQVVHPDDCAWHAGEGSWCAWQGRSTGNSFSIGIEHVNLGFLESKETQELVWTPFDEKQIDSSISLSKRLVEKYKISPTNVIGHSDYAPHRKQDPGPLFPYEKFYEQGVGAWLEQKEQNEKFLRLHSTSKEIIPQGISDSFFLTYLQRYGYTTVQDCTANTPQNKEAVKAFQMHFSANQKANTWPNNGEITRNDMIWIAGLCAKYHI